MSLNNENRSSQDTFLEDLVRINGEAMAIKCEATIDGYRDFFVNRNGATQRNIALKKTIRRVIRGCTNEVLLEGKDPRATSSL